MFFTRRWGCRVSDIGLYKAADTMKIKTGSNNSTGSYEHKNTTLSGKIPLSSLTSSLTSALTSSTHNSVNYSTQLTIQPSSNSVI